MTVVHAMPAIAVKVPTQLRIVVAAAAAIHASCFAASQLAEIPDASRFVMFAPHPEYPFEARAHGISGRGLFLLRVHIESGQVKEVIVGSTTGNKVLDRAAVAALGKWRFKPGVLPHPQRISISLDPPLTADDTLVKVPVAFQLGRPDTIIYLPKR